MIWQTIDLDTAPVGWGRPVATIGNFDGLHIGHQRIIARCAAAASAQGERAVVITFDPHPVKVLHPGSSFCCLKTPAQRRRDLAAMGVDAVALVRFDRELMGTAPERFVERVLVRALGIGQLLVGPGFRFGHRRSGDLDLLARLGARSGFSALSVPPVVRGGSPVSSTRVRQALADGDVGSARRLLGGPYQVAGVVVAGAGRGRQLGFATANLSTYNECTPGPGVYGTRVVVDGKPYRGASFIGEAATFGDTRRVFESHLLDWTGADLYDRELTVEFLCRLRDGQRFPSPDLLVAQLARDVKAVRRRVRLPAAR